MGPQEAEAQAGVQRTRGLQFIGGRGCKSEKSCLFCRAKCPWLRRRLHVNTVPSHAPLPSTPLLLPWLPLPGLLHHTKLPPPSPPGCCCCRPHLSSASASSCFSFSSLAISSLLAAASSLLPCRRVAAVAAAAALLPIGGSCCSCSSSSQLLAALQARSCSRSSLLPGPGQLAVHPQCRSSLPSLHRPPRSSTQTLQNTLTLPCRHLNVPPAPPPTILPHKPSSHLSSHHNSCNPPHVRPP